MTEQRSPSPRPAGASPAAGRASAGRGAAGRAKGQGQWALGHREPLNANEQFKKDDDGLNVRARIENIYAKRGFDSIDPTDLRGRMRWWGLYTQRKPGHRRRQDRHPGAGGARRQVLHAAGPHRRRSADHRRSCASIARGLRGRTRRDTADLTDRQNIQLHWIRIEDVPGDLASGSRPSGCPPPRRAATARASSSARPVAGIAADEIIDATPAIEEIVDALHRRPGVLQPAAQVQDRDLRASRRTDVAHEINDIAFVGVVHPEHGPGLRPVGRRRAVHQPDARPAARRLGAAGGGRRTSGRASIVDLPRLRLPAAAAPGPAEVPGRRLGRRRSSARCWRRST